MSNSNLDGMNIQIGGGPKSDRPAEPPKRSAKEVLRMGTVAAGEEWRKSKKNI